MNKEHQQQQKSSNMDKKHQQQQKSSNMDKKFRNQLLAESGKKEEEIESVNLEIEERVQSENGIFVLIRNKKNKWVITMCGSILNAKEFDTKEEAEEHIAKKEWEDILTATFIFILHVNEEMKNNQTK